LADSRIQARAVCEWRLEQAIIVLEMESLLGVVMSSQLQNPKLFPRFVQVLRPSHTSEAYAKSDWSGTLGVLSTRMATFEARLKERLDRSERQMERRLDTLTGRVEKLEKVINKQVDNMASMVQGKLSELVIRMRDVNLTVANSLDSERKDSARRPPVGGAGDETPSHREGRPGHLTPLKTPLARGGTFAGEERSFATRERYSLGEHEGDPEVLFRDSGGSESEMLRRSSGGQLTDRSGSRRSLPAIGEDRPSSEAGGSRHEGGQPSQQGPSAAGPTQRDAQQPEGEGFLDNSAFL
jgi:hypothetical protein